LPVYFCLSTSTRYSGTTTVARPARTDAATPPHLANLTAPLGANVVYSRGKGETRLRLILDYLSVFFGVTTVVGFVLAFYWHAQSAQERTPMYYVGPQRARLVDTSVQVPSQLQVLYRGKDLSRNVNALTLYLWNYFRYFSSSILR
jgi:hypothetical protein